MNFKSDSKIIEASKNLEDWINDPEQQLHHCIANIHRQRLELHYAKHEDHGEFINQWVRLGTVEELRKVDSIVNHIVDCLSLKVKTKTPQISIKEHIN